MPPKIAIVEDEPHIRDNFADAFRQQGYHVDAYSNRPQAMSAFSQQLPELAIIDIGLEDEIDGGFDLCRELRALSDTLPIIFLTARDNDYDTIAGLRLGANDYLTKDISLPHLQARVAALLKRVNALTASHHEDKIINRQLLQINMDKLLVLWNQQQLDVTLTEFWIIHALSVRVGHVKTPDQLMDAANTYVDPSTITSHIKRIRKKFRQLDDSFDHIQTIYGRGYRWIEQQ
jgi:two-component system, OmpR family, response regulator